MGSVAACLVVLTTRMLLEHVSAAGGGGEKHGLLHTLGLDAGATVGL